MIREVHGTKEKIVLEIIGKGINESTMKELDSNIDMIPITYDKIIKNLFENNIFIFKRFIKSVLHLDIDNIIINNTEVPITFYNEYKKVIDFNILINNIDHLNIEVNRDYYVNVKFRNDLYFSKIVGLSLKKGDDIKNLKKIKNYQLNLNAREKNPKIGEDTIVSYSLAQNKVEFENKKIYVRYLDYYRKKYYNNFKLTEDELWLTLLTSENFYELYEILGKLVDNETREKIIKDVVMMNMDYVIFDEFEQRRGEELINYIREENFRKQQEEMEKQQEEMEKQQEEMEKQQEEIKKQQEKTKKEHQKEIKKAMANGIEQGKLDLIKSMLNNNADYNFISNVTGKSIDEIKIIEKSIK